MPMMRHRQRPPFGGVVRRGQPIIPNRSDITPPVPPDPPANYTVTWDTALVDQSNETAAPFTIDASLTVVNAQYNYTITSSGGVGSVTGNRVILAGQTSAFTADVSGLPDGTLTVSVQGVNSGGSGPVVTDTVAKNTVIPEFPDGWTRRAPIDISATITSADLTDFPVLIQAGSLPDEAVTTGGPNAALPDGGDLRFTSDLAGTNLLDHEIVNFTQDAVPANATAEIWVKVPTVSGTVTTTIYAWYGKAGETAPGLGALWSAYDHVYHFEGNANDSVGGVTLAAAFGTALQFGQGLFGGPLGAYIAPSSSGGFWHPGANPSSLFPGSGPVTLQQVASSVNTGTHFRWDDSFQTGGGVQLRLGSTSNRMRVDQSDGGAFVLVDAPVETAGQIYVVHDQWQSNGRCYRYSDGVDVTSGTPSFGATNFAGNTRTGIAQGEPSLAADGPGIGSVLDELRVSAAILAPEWIAAENSMFRNSETLITPGAPATP